MATESILHVENVSKSHSPVGAQSLQSVPKLSQISRSTQPCMVVLVCPSYIGYVQTLKLDQSGHIQMYLLDFLHPSLMTDTAKCLLIC